MCEILEQDVNPCILIWVIATHPYIFIQYDLPFLPHLVF